MVLSIAILTALWAFLKYTRSGYAIRATTHNRTAAATVGVNVDRVSMHAFGIGLALAGASGSLLTFLFSFFPNKHWEWARGIREFPTALAHAIQLVIASARTVKPDSRRGNRPAVRRRHRR